MHFYGLNFSGKSSGGESNNHTWFQQTSFDTTDWYCSNTSNLRFVGGSAWWQDSVKSFNEGGTFTVTVFTFNLPSLEPSHFAGCLQHVVSVPSRDGDESNSGWVVTNLLDVRRYFLLDFLETGLRVGWLGGVHLVDSDNQLLDTKGESKESVLTGLTVL
ncbi:GSCOCG00000798001-RA-CDS [Cotesia congregata]|nr:GSCOCG00000798001-RA-CDS [Cotesia congregata]